FDELKNQWGWGGFTTHDLARCQLAARNVGLIYNWWSLFVRLAESGQHLEAHTGRHARPTTLRVASSHGRAGWAAAALAQIAQFLGTLTNAAEQLTPLERWYRILSRALRHFLKGRQLRAPPRLAKAAVSCSLKLKFRPADDS